MAGTVTMTYVTHSPLWMVNKRRSSETPLILMIPWIVSTTVLHCQIRQTYHDIRRRKGGAEGRAGCKT